MKKLFPIIAIFIALVLVGAQCGQTGKTPGVSKTAQKTEIPSDWKSYENTTHGMSFSYPSDWEFSVITDNADSLSVNLAKEDKVQEKIEVYTEEMIPSYSIYLTAEKNEKGMSAQELYLDMFGESSKDEAAKKMEEYTVSGITGIKYPEGAAPASGPVTMVLVTKGDKAYRFSYGALATKETHEKFLDVFNTILETVNIE